MCGSLNFSKSIANLYLSLLLATCIWHLADFCHDKVAFYTWVQTQSHQLNTNQLEARGQ
jgi:hypothetical protein